MLSKLILCSLNLLVLIGAQTAGGRAPLHRNKRYLVYPDGGPARAQFILGLGVPVDIKEQTVTVGTVIKFQYDLPTNSTEYTSRIYGFANTIDSRDIANKDTKDEKIIISKENAAPITENYEKKSWNEDTNATEPIIETDSLINDIDDDNNTLVDIEFDNERIKRAMYMEGGADVQMNAVNQNTELPLEEAIKRQEELDKAYLEQEPEMRRTNRWDLYRIMEMMAEKYGYSGRPCMLRTVCEAAEIPFTHKNGLLGEITHILFTPSSTKDILSHHSDNEYHAAERLGRDTDVDCESLFPECEASLLETFTQVGLETLHKFGF